MNNRLLAAVCALLPLLLAVAPVAAQQTAPAPQSAPRLTLNFDNDWRFFKGDPAGAPSAAYKETTPWRQLNLPHDWSIEGPFDQNAPTTGAGANLPSGVAWYRKQFTLPPEAAGKKVFIEFDGVMANSEVYLNNSLLGVRPNGYASFRYDLTDFIDFKGPNIMAVRTDTSRQPASRWYTGAGIYRHTRLVIENPVHVDQWATFITTPKIENDRATIHVNTVVENQTGSGRNIFVSVRITDDLGAIAGTFFPITPIAPNASKDFEQDIVITNPNIWDIANPHLYKCIVTVDEPQRGPPGADGQLPLDSETVSFGIRTAEFRADTGFWLNGKNIKLLGVALHHDAGGLGAAVPISAWESRLSALKALGVNAIRTAHNPPAPEFLDVCDRLGLLVMDEAFDAWTVGKEPADGHLYFKDWWQRDLDAMIARDRNHPSIVIYSLGNEIWDLLPQNPDPAFDANTGAIRPITLAKDIFIPLRDRAHELDPSRPVTMAVLRPNVSGIYTNGFAEIMDVVGQNYRDNELAAAHVQNPARKIIGTENYHERPTWLALRDNPALAGQFLWTGVDYLGEARAWPTIASSAGLLDRTNFPKNNAFERESWWSTKPVVHIARTRTPPPAAPAPAAAAVPTTTAANVNAPPPRPPAVQNFHDWTPADTAAHDEPVNVYSNCQSVELFLNDQSLGVKPLNTDASPRQWTIPFVSGTLKAVAKNNVIVATEELKTAAAPAQIALTAERTRLPNDPEDVLYVRALVNDAAGTLNPNAANLISFKLTGPGQIVCTDNGNPASHEDFHSPDRMAYQGTCIAVIRATADTGRITVSASSSGLKDAAITIEAAPAAR